MGGPSKSSRPRLLLLHHQMTQVQEQVGQMGVPILSLSASTSIAKAGSQRVLLHHLLLRPSALSRRWWQRLLQLQLGRDRQPSLGLGRQARQLRQPLWFAGWAIIVLIVILGSTAWAGHKMLLPCPVLVGDVLSTTRARTFGRTFILLFHAVAAVTLVLCQSR